MFPAKLYGIGVFMFFFFLSGWAQAQDNTPGPVNKTETKARKANRKKKEKKRDRYSRKKKKVRKHKQAPHLKPGRSKGSPAMEAVPPVNPGKAKTVYPEFATDLRMQARERANRKKKEAIPFEGIFPPGSVQTVYGDRKGTRQPDGKAQEVWLAPELFPPGPVDIFHVNRPLKFERRNWRADRKHQRKMNKIYPSAVVDYQTQKQQQKAAKWYAKALWKNYHANPDFRQVWLTPELQQKAEEKYIKALWNSYGKKKSEYEEMQKAADKRRAKLEKAFRKPVKKELPDGAKKSLTAAAGFNGFIIIDPKKERKLSFEAAKFRNEFYLPLRIQLVRRNSAFSVKGSRKHYAPFQPLQFGLFISPYTNKQLKLKPKFLKKRKRLKYDKGEAKMWNELKASTRASAEATIGGGEAGFVDDVEYQYNPNLDLENDPSEETPEEEPPVEEEEEDDGGNGN